MKKKKKNIDILLFLLNKMNITCRIVLRGFMQNHPGPKNICKKTRKTCTELSSMWGGGYLAALIGTISGIVCHVHLYIYSLNPVPNAQVWVYLTVHITKLQLQTTFPKPLYIPHSACIHWDPGR